jgi:organic radical activating enzyme
MAEHINRNAPNKYITIGGGEPTDQIENLIILCKELKKYDFHIMMYTWKSLKTYLSPFVVPIDQNGNVTNNSERDKMKELLKYVDIIVDGQFKIEEKLWDGTKEDGLLSSVGSGNQIIWNIPYGYGYSMRDINRLEIRIYESNKNVLRYYLKNSENEIRLYD